MLIRPPRSKRQGNYLDRRRKNRKAEDTTPVGFRRDYAALVRSVVEQHRHLVLTGLATEEIARDFIASVALGIKKHSRTDKHLYAQMMKMVEAEPTIIVEFVKRFGVSDESELRRLVDTAKSAEGVDVLTSIERCAAYLEAVLPMHEKHRSVVIRRLGGYLPVTSDNVTTDG